MPASKLKGRLMHFAAWKNHIGFYHTPSEINEFKNELLRYDVSKAMLDFRSVIATAINAPTTMNAKTRMEIQINGCIMNLLYSDVYDCVPIRAG